MTYFNKSSFQFLFLNLVHKKDINKLKNNWNTTTRSIVKKSIVVNDTDMISVQPAKSGIFEPLVKVGDTVKEGTPLANIVGSYEGEVLETLYAPVEGTIFFITIFLTFNHENRNVWSSLSQNVNEVIS